MERKNMLTIGIVAVVIVIVLAGTYLYMRDDGGDHDGLRDLELGDTLYMANIDIVDGEETRYLSDMYAAATIDGNTYFVYQSNLGEYRVVTWDVEDPVLIETDVTVENVFGGEVTCDLYSLERSGEETYLYLNDQMDLVVAHIVSEDGTTERWSYLIDYTSPDIGRSTVDYDMEAGDSLERVQGRGDDHDPRELRQLRRGLRWQDPRTGRVLQPVIRIQTVRHIPDL